MMWKQQTKKKTACNNCISDQSDHEKYSEKKPRPKKKITDFAILVVEL